MMKNNFSDKEKENINMLVDEEIYHIMTDIKKITCKSLSRLKNRCDIEECPESWVVSSFMLRLTINVISMTIYPIRDRKEYKDIMINEITEYLLRIKNES